MQSNLLILDDDAVFVRAASEIATQLDFHVRAATSLAEARDLLSSHRFDLLLLDLELPDGSGLDLAEEVNAAMHGHIALITGKPSIETAARALGSPVVQYLIKPMQPAQLVALLKRTQRRISAGRLSPCDTSLVGRSHAMQEVLHTIETISPTDASVLISGESGTGKELIARAMHERSGARGEFVAINCGAVASELLASELFGHERGSFTGAHTRHAGVFEQAAHGTLLLDEIGEMPMALQVYLLRVLESGSVTRVGGTQSIDIPVRIIAATNVDPLAAVAAGKLRQDLYYRLADIPLRVPALRERDDDVILLTTLFISRLNERYGRQKYLERGSEHALLHHSWPGNVRELRSVVQRAYLLQPDDALCIRPAAPPCRLRDEYHDSIVFSVGTTLADMERRVLLKTLAHFDNDKSAAARTLGVSVRTIHNHLARMAEADEKLLGAAA